MKKEYKKILIVVGIILGLVILSQIEFVNSKYFKEITIDEYLEMIEEDKPNIIMIGRDSCSACKSVKKSLISISYKEKLTMYYLNTDAFKNKLEDLNKLENTNEVFSSDFTVPMVIVSGASGEFFDVSNGNKKRSELKKFITDALNELAPLKNITFNEFDSLINGEEKVIIFVARPTCTYCIQFKPILESVLSSHGLVAYYLDTDTLSEEEMYGLQISNDFMMNNEWGTPTILVFESGSFIAPLSGAVPEEDLINFLKTYGFIG